MRARMTFLRRVLPAAALAVVVSGSVIAQEAIDLEVIHRIRQEAFQNSKVMDHLFYLTDVSSPCLTNSPGFYAAADWVVKQLGAWGIKARQEKWGPYGRGWEYTRFSAHMTAPVSTPLIGVPLAFAPGTDGPVTGEALIVSIADESDFA